MTKQPAPEPKPAHVRNDPSPSTRQTHPADVNRQARHDRVRDSVVKK